MKWKIKNKMEERESMGQENFGVAQRHKPMSTTRKDRAR
jgi:hypothetical protein